MEQHVLTFVGTKPQFSIFIFSNNLMVMHFNILQPARFYTLMSYQVMANTSKIYVTRQSNHQNNTFELSRFIDTTLYDTLVAIWAVSSVVGKVIDASLKLIDLDKDIDLKVNLYDGPLLIWENNRSYRNEDVM